MARDAEAVALFPELRRDASLEARQARMDERESTAISRLRALRCAHWKKARALIRSLSVEERTRLLARWNTQDMPGDPAYLLSLYRKMFIHKDCPTCGGVMGDGVTCHDCRSLKVRENGEGFQGAKNAGSP